MRIGRAPCVAWQRLNQTEYAAGAEISRALSKN
jgi:hypothetical protein